MNMMTTKQCGYKIKTENYLKLKSYCRSKKIRESDVVNKALEHFFLTLDED